MRLNRWAMTAVTWLALGATACAAVATGAPAAPAAPKAAQAAPPPAIPDAGFPEATPGAGFLPVVPTLPAPEATPTPAPPPPTPTPEPAPPAGRFERTLMPDTPYATPLYIIQSGVAGPVVLVLGGVHGDEQAGWTSAAEVVKWEPVKGILMVIPNANKVADSLGVRTTAFLGDLNRLYPGDPDGALPMARMAAVINALVGEFKVNILLDMHESWGLFAERPCSSTAFLGQTVGVSSTLPGAQAFGQAVVDRANLSAQAQREILYFRGSAGGGPGGPNGRGPNDGVPPCAAPGVVNQAGERGGPSGTLSTVYPGLMAFLTETSTQLYLSRRIAMHLAVAESILLFQGMLAE